jgi:hypothetical protein
MREREKPRPRDAQPRPPAASGGDQLDAYQEAAARLRAAADEAADRILSGDSARFVDAARQDGGQ